MPVKWTTEKKMDKILEMYNMPRLNQEKTRKYEQSVQLPVMKLNHNFKIPNKQKSRIRGLHR